MKRKYLWLVLALALAVMVLPVTAYAAGSDFVIVGGVPDVDYFYDWDGVLTINTNTALAISGITTTDKIVVAAGITANITLDGVIIDLTSTGDCAFYMTGSTVNMTLAGNNVLKSGGDYAGLQCPSGAFLIISGPGSLEATGGSYGAGIGGGNNMSSGNITINAGTITAKGGDGYGGAGIGGGYVGGSGTITVSGGTVTATGGSQGAGIGSGPAGNCGDITITGGMVVANGGSWSAGIGGSNNSFSGGSILILGGTVTANGGHWGAGIGRGYNCNSGGNVNIGGGRVTATGGIGGAGIGGGNGEYGGGDSGTIAISGGTVTATGNGGGAGLGGGSGGDSGNTAISGGSVRASSIGATITNGGSEVLLTAVILQNVSAVTRVSSLTITGAPGYGAYDLYTDENGTLYLYLPEGATITAAQTGSARYTGSVVTTGDAGTSLGTLAVAPDGSPDIVTSSLPDGTVGTPYSQVLAADGDTPITWSINSGSLPGGLGLSNGGIISGLPTAAGTYTFTVIALNSAGSDTQTLSIEIIPAAPPGSPPVITTDTLPNATVFMEYNQTLSVTSDMPVTWDMVGPFPNNGLGFFDGVVSGTPLVSGTFYFTVRATNSAGSVTKEFSITILPPAPPAITTTSLPDGKVGTPYSRTLTADGSTPVTWNIVNGSLPDGLTLTGDTISGTPILAGTFNFTVKAENGEGSDTKELHIVIAPAGGPGGDTSEKKEPRYISRTLTGGLPDMDIIVSGEGIRADAKLYIVPIPPNAEGYGAYSSAIGKASEEGRLILSCNIRLTGGFIGRVTVSFHVGERYNGEAITILHYNGNRVETYTVVVNDGWASIVVDGLSPFAVIRTGIAMPDELVPDPPKTGGAQAGGLVLLGLAVVSLTVAVFRRRRNI